MTSTARPRHLWRVSSRIGATRHAAAMWPWFRRHFAQTGARNRLRRIGSGLPSMRRGRASNSATRNLPAQARNASSC